MHSASERDRWTHRILVDGAWVNPPSAKAADRAQAFVLASETGVTASVVAAAIGQTTRAATATLRRVVTSRNSIVEVRGKWLPNGWPGLKPQELTIRVAVTLALSREGPLTLPKLFQAVEKIRPKSTRGSISSRVMRMLESPVSSKTCGHNEHGMISTRSPSTWRRKGSL